MIIDINEYTDFLCRNKMTPSQFYLCFLLYADKRIKLGDGSMVLAKKGSMTANIYKYSRKVGFFDFNEIEDLLKRGYIEPDGKPPPQAEGFYPDYYKVGYKFEEEIFIRSDSFMEVWNLYPKTIDNFHNARGPKVKLKVLKDMDVEDLAKIYHSKVTTRALHERVVESLKWAVEKGELNVSIQNFVNSHHWETLIEMMGEHVGASNMTTV